MPVNSSPMCIILRKVNHHWLLWFLSALVVNGAVAGNPDAKRLYDDLLSNYNKLVRPVVNTSDVLRVCIKLKLSQLIDVVSSQLNSLQSPVFLFYLL
jgi:Neurotransmitter-gated ion-channel ligand binding domain